MSKYIYRGVVVESVAQSETLAQQMKKPNLVYRGVRHNGEKSLNDEVKTDIKELFYRGAHYA